MEEEKTSTRIKRGDSKAMIYRCAWCIKLIGTISDVKYRDKFDRVYCCSDCSMKAYNSPSRDYEKRGGDY